MSISEANDPLLEVRCLSAFHGELAAVRDLSLSLDKGEVISLIGANGAGKSTFLKSLTGQMTAAGAGRITGDILFEGRPIDALMPYDIVDLGIAMVPEGRRLFHSMTVEENLTCGAFIQRSRRHLAQKKDEIFSLFPRLAERRHQPVSQMSGGEQQMVAIGRALMSSPRLLLLDELSLGLSPAMVEEIYRRIEAIVAEGLTAILVEQDLDRALRASHKFAVMLEGEIVLSGLSAQADRHAVTAGYFGENMERGTVA